MLLVFPVEWDAWYAGHLNTLISIFTILSQKSPHGGRRQCAVTTLTKKPKKQYIIHTVYIS